MLIGWTLISDRFLFQFREFLSSYNKLSEMCFTDCVHDMTTRKILDSEVLCACCMGFILEYGTIRFPFELYIFFNQVIICCFNISKTRCLISEFWLLCLWSSQFMHWLSYEFMPCTHVHINVPHVKLALDWKSGIKSEQCFLWQNCSNVNIKSIAILQNYSSRFPLPSFGVEKQPVKVDLIGIEARA